MTDDERAIRDLIATWMRASEAGDVNTVMSLMADDVIFMVPGREPFGKEVFRAASETMKNVARRLGLYPQRHRDHDHAARRHRDAANRIHALDPSQTA